MTTDAGEQLLDAATTLTPSWEKTWRDGFTKVLPEAGIALLRQALITDDKRLIQGGTTNPPLLMCVQDFAMCAGCAITLAAVGRYDCTVGEAEEAFAKACSEADEKLDEPAACRWFLNWFDDTPRDEMRRELLRVLA